MDFETGKVIAAVRCDEDFDRALNSDVKVIFVLSSTVLEVASMALMAKRAGKRMFIHMDLCEGVGKDKAGVEFLKNAGVFGIISTRVNIIRFAREAGLKTVQRFFIVDSHSVDTTLEGLKSGKPDMMELMPGTVTKIISRIREKSQIPIIAGGLIETKAEVSDAMLCGAYAVSTGNKNLWE